MRFKYWLHWSYNGVTCCAVQVFTVRGIKCSAGGFRGTQQFKHLSQFYFYWTMQFHIHSKHTCKLTLSFHITKSCSVLLLYVNKLQADVWNCFGINDVTNTAELSIFSRYMSCMSTEWIYWSTFALSIKSFDFTKARKIWFPWYGLFKINNWLTSLQFNWLWICICQGKQGLDQI